MAQPTGSQYARQYVHGVRRRARIYSTLPSLVRVDGRTKEAQLMRRARDELTAHIGGSPNAAQRILIERCCWLSLRIALLDRKLASGRDFTQIDSNVYLAWANSLSRMLVKLGIEQSTAIKRPTLQDINREVGLND